METTGSIQNPFLLWPQEASWGPVLVGVAPPYGEAWLALKLVSELPAVGSAPRPPPPQLSHPLDENVVSTDWRAWVQVQRQVGIRGY